MRHDRHAKLLDSQEAFFHEAIVSVVHDPGIRNVAAKVENANSVN